MKYIICYDIPEERIRRKAAKLLESKAYRVQYSVFIGDLSEFEARALREELLAITEASEKRLLLMAPMCAACEAKSCRAGTALAVSFGDAFPPGSLLRLSGLMFCANAGGSSPPSPRGGWARDTGPPGSGARTPSGCQLWAKEVPGASGSSGVCVG